MDISKKYDFKESEERWRKYWEDEKIFAFEENSEKQIFSVDTPPPYASADHLHHGHIMSYAQAEFIVRYKRMRGFNVFYPMGFDDNGLPTERFVEKKYNIDKSKISKKEFIELCLKETEISSQTYKKLWYSLGVSVDWSRTYSTISPLATKVSQGSLIDLYKKKALYQKEAPVLWCPSCQTALAQADLEDKEEESKINYINFKGEEDGSSLTIATTRPELLPACVALYVNPTDKRYIDLIDKMAKVPLFDYSIPIKSSEKVDVNFGTGIMMVCTWGDKEDLEKWQLDNLDTRPLILENGKLGELAGKYQGLDLRDAREKIIDDLKNDGLLEKQEDITHSLNVHERCSTPVEFVNSKQWFIKISTPDLKEKWLEMGKKIKWHPEDKFKILEMWVNSLKWDWCISRQRYYGVPLPIWYCEECSEPIFADEKDLPVNPIEDKPPVDKCPKCGSNNIKPEEDVMDTWATSSCTQFLIRELVESKKDKERLYPPVVRPNAFEIIRTWDFYSIVRSFYQFNDIPFENLMISGWGLGQDGKKLSKRLKNYTPPEEVISEHGADSFRYWATGAGLGQNLRFSLDEIQKGKKTTTKLWNAFKFLSMQIENFDLNKVKAFKDASLDYSDNWIIEELNSTIRLATTEFEKYEFAKTRNYIDDFFWSKFTDRYLEFVKYRLYGDDIESKIAAQWTLYKVFLSILKLFAPIMPFVTEEIYQFGFRDIEGYKSIHISNWPDEISLGDSQQKSLKDFYAVLDLIDEIKRYKSENNLSIGAELENYQLKKIRPNIDIFGDFIKKVMRIKNLLV